MTGGNRLAPEIRGLERTLRHNAAVPHWTPQTHRDNFEAAAATRPLHTDVHVRPTTMLGDVPAEVHTPRAIRGPEMVLYLHGGGFIMGSLATSRPLASHLAAAVGRPVVVPEYSLAPEERFPVQAAETVQCYAKLRRMTGKPVVLLGDSAGAALCLRAAQQTAADRPHALVLLSPFLDLRLDAESIDVNLEFDPQTPRWLLQQMVDHYLGPNSTPNDPAASPLLGDLAGLPPALLQVAELEGLRDDAIQFERAATCAGAHVDLEIWPGMIHVWHSFAPRLPQAVEALTRIGDWLDGLQS